MQDYVEWGLDNRLRRTKLKTEYVSALEEDARVEKSRLVNNQVTKGTVQTTAGGLVEFNSTSGGTILLTIDPVTGTVTVAGPVIANVTLNVGSMNNGAITGTSTITGTLTASNITVLGTFSGGTYNNIIAGTPNISGGTLNEAFIGSPRLTVNSGSGGLPFDGAIAIQTYSGSAILAARLLGTTFRFMSGGTL